MEQPRAGMSIVSMNPWSNPKYKRIPLYNKAVRCFPIIPPEKSPPRKAMKSSSFYSKLVCSLAPSILNPLISNASILFYYQELNPVDLKNNATDNRFTDFIYLTTERKSRRNWFLIFIAYLKILYFLILKTNWNRETKTLKWF